MRSQLTRGLASAVPVLAVLVLALVPSTAAANTSFEHIYCDQYLVVNGTCPPNGSSEWGHLEENFANAGGASHATCVDDFIEKPANTPRNIRPHTACITEVKTQSKSRWKVRMAIPAHGTPEQSNIWW